jgi:transcriptional regulator of met regulon
MANISIHSEEQIVPKNIVSLYDFISDFRNFKALLPEDRITDYQSDIDWCEFTIIGLTKIYLKTAVKTPYELVRVKSEHVRNIEIEISIILNKIDENTTRGQVNLEADTNAFLKIMVENPLKNLANMIAKKMHDLPV